MQVTGKIKKLPDNGFMLKSNEGEYIIHVEDATEFTNDTVGLLASAEVNIFPIFGKNGFVKLGTLQVPI